MPQVPRLGPGRRHRRKWQVACPSCALSLWLELPSTTLCCRYAGAMGTIRSTVLDLPRGGEALADPSDYAPMIPVLDAIQDSDPDGARPTVIQYKF